MSLETEYRALVSCARSLMYNAVDYRRMARRYPWSGDRFQRAAKSSAEAAWAHLEWARDRRDWMLSRREAQERGEAA